MADGDIDFTRRELQYCEALLFEVGNGGILRNTLKRLKGRTDTAYTRGELASLLHHEDSTSAHNFLKKLLEETDVLVPVGEKQTASKPVPTYEVDKTALKETLGQSDWYQSHPDLRAEMVDYMGDF